MASPITWSEVRSVPGLLRLVFAHGARCHRLPCTPHRQFCRPYLFGQKQVTGWFVTSFSFLPISFHFTDELLFFFTKAYWNFLILINFVRAVHSWERSARCPPVTRSWARAQRTSLNSASRVLSSLEVIIYCLHFIALGNVSFKLKILYWGI